MSRHKWISKTYNCWICTECEAEKKREFDPKVGFRMLYTKKGVESRYAPPCKESKNKKAYQLDLFEAINKQPEMKYDIFADKPF